jgi:hypothetical protein
LAISLSCSRNSELIRTFNKTLAMCITHQLCYNCCMVTQ